MLPLAGMIALAKPLVFLLVLVPFLPRGDRAVEADKTPPIASSRLALARTRPTDLVPLAFQRQIPTNAGVPPLGSAEVTEAERVSIGGESFSEPAGCKRPPDEYESILVGGRILSRRTLAMLEHAQLLYGGRIQLTGAAFLSGGDYEKGRMSLDPPAGPGVIRLSVTEPISGRLQYQEIDAAIQAMRVAGFAAWLREPNASHPGSEPHILAIAIGERGLSDAATEQLTGKFGYFLGRQGLSGAPDPHGGPIVCHWMVEPGGPVTDGSLFPSPGWKDRLREVADSFITTSPDATGQLARSLDFMRTPNEDPSNMCGPLSAAILRAAGLLPWSAGPVADLKNYWLADPLTNGRPWSLFPTEGYELHHFAISIHRFDFETWPLFPGDFVFMYSGSGAFSHIFVVTEVDYQGRAHTVTNMVQPDGSYLIQKILLYDLTGGHEGALEGQCEDCTTWARLTGLGGFDVLRRSEVSLEPGTSISYAVRPGDTLINLSSRFTSTVAAIRQANSLVGDNLQPGMEIRIPVNLAEGDSTLGEFEF